MASASSDPRPTDGTAPQTVPAPQQRAAATAPTGALSDALGFLAFIAIPFLRLPAARAQAPTGQT